MVMNPLVDVANCCLLNKGRLMEHPSILSHVYKHSYHGYLTSQPRALNSPPKLQISWRMKISISSVGYKTIINSLLVFKYAITLCV